MNEETESNNNRIFYFAVGAAKCGWTPNRIQESVEKIGIQGTADMMRISKSSLNTLRYYYGLCEG